MAEATKAVTKRAYNRKPKEQVFWVLIRKGILSDRVVGVYSTEKLAREDELAMENDASFSFRSYTVQRAELVK